MGAVKEIQDADYDAEVVQAPTPVVLDFSGAWCQPCKQLEPILDQLAGAYAGKVKFVKMMIEDNEATPMQFGVSAVPTLVFLKGGKEAGRVIGYRPKDELDAKIKALL